MSTDTIILEELNAITPRQETVRRLVGLVNRRAMQPLSMAGLTLKLEELERNGLVSFLPDPVDRSELLWFITSTGRAALASR